MWGDEQQNPILIKDLQKKLVALLSKYPKVFKISQVQAQEHQQPPKSMYLHFLKCSL